METHRFVKQTSHLEVQAEDTVVHGAARQSATALPTQTMYSQVHDNPLLVHKTHLPGTTLHGTSARHSHQVRSVQRTSHNAHAHTRPDRGHSLRDDHARTRLGGTRQPGRIRAGRIPSTRADATFWN